MTRKVFLLTIINAQAGAMALILQDWIQPIRKNPSEISNAARPSQHLTAKSSWSSQKSAMKQAAVEQVAIA